MPNPHACEARQTGIPAPMARWFSAAFEFRWIER
jgi:hypothetical protein